MKKEQLKRIREQELALKETLKKLEKEEWMELNQQSQGVSTEFLDKINHEGLEV